MSKDYPKFKWCVYTDKVGRTEVGVYERYVDIVDDAAYVLPKADGIIADIIPAANVFEKKTDALAYMAGTGVERWVVSSGGYGDVATLFRGRVKFFMTKKHGHMSHAQAAVRLSDGKAFDGHNLRTFDTCREAEKYHAKVWKQNYGYAMKDLKQQQERVDAMLDAKPRSRKKAP